MEASVDHKSQQILNIVKGENSSVRVAPQAFVVHRPTASFQSATQSGNELWVRDSNLEVPALLVALESIDVLPQCDFHALDDRSILCQFGFKESFEWLAIFLGEADGGGDVKVMLKSSDVKQD
jgi:hypothetical protein